MRTEKVLRERVTKIKKYRDRENSRVMKVRKIRDINKTINIIETRRDEMRSSRHLLGLRETDRDQNELRLAKSSTRSYI